MQNQNQEQNWNRDLECKLFWKPHPGPQEKFLEHFYVDEILYGGAKGGGKTDVLLWDFIDNELIQKSNYRGIIFRRTFPRLTEIIDRSLKWFTGQAEYNKGERCWEWPTGAKLYFRHCQFEESKYDYQGHEYQYMGFDQLEEFTQSQYEFLKVQCRTTDPKIKVRIRATANPGNIGHLWVKQLFIDNREPFVVYKNHLGLTSMFIPAKVYDNPSLTENDPTYIKRLENLPEIDRKALLHGDWDVFAGQYFKEWRRDLHIRDIDNFSVNPGFNRFIAGDYGFKKPASVGWYQIDYDGNITRYKEIYGDGLHYDTLAEKILDMTSADEMKKMMYAVFDPAIWGDREHHKRDRVEGKSGADIMMEIFGNKIGLVKADNRRIAGWSFCRKMLKDRKFRVTSNCINFLRTFPALIHDDKNPEDVNSDGEDHCGDELRYALTSRPSQPEHQPKIPLRKSLEGQMRLAKMQKQKTW